MERSTFTVRTRSGDLSGWVVGDGPPAARVPSAWSRVERGVGHFVWLEAPGCVLAAVDRLVAGP